MKKKTLNFLFHLLLFITLLAFIGCADPTSSGGGGDDNGTTQTYKVNYDGNTKTSGDVPEDSNDYLSNSTVTVLGNTGSLEKTGYTFTGWNTQSDGNGTTYTQNQTFTIGSSNITLYAKWTTNPTYTVRYSGIKTTGDFPVDSTHYEQGTTVTVPGNTGNLTRTNYNFAGWNTQSSGSGTNYTQGQTFTMGSSNITLYAKWNPTYSVTYASNIHTGGDVPVDNNRYEQGAPVTTLGNTGNLIKFQHIFKCWNTFSGGHGTDYYPGQEFPMYNGNITLHAMWKSCYKVSFECNGGTSLNYIAQEQISEIPVTNKSFYALEGWYTDSSFSTEKVSFPYTPTADIKLYAKWIPATPGLSYEKNSTGYTVTKGTANVSNPVTIPDYWLGLPVTEIGADAFYDCGYLPSVTLSSNLTKIGDRAFYCCSSLTSITIPDDVTSLGVSAFASCSNLETVSMPSGVTELNSTFSYCRKLKTITLPTDLTKIGKNSFYNCESLTSSIIIPSGVDLVDEKAFYGCTLLTNVTISEGVRAIYLSAFNGCSSLESIILPASIRGLDGYAFFACGLKYIEVHASDPPTMYGDRGHQFGGPIEYIKVPAGSVEAYKNKDGWGNYTSLISALD